jgi:uncharacterized protein
MKRRTFIKSILALAGISGIYAWQIEPFWLEFVKKKMPIQHLPEALSGLTLLQISDIHVGNRFDWKYLIQSFEKAKTLQPDFVVYTGDFVCYENEQQFEQLKTVMGSAVKGRLATIAILGNHDYGKNWAEKEVANRITQILSEVGIVVLRNQQINVDGLNIIGMDDYWGKNFDPKTAMQQYNPEQATIVLCHNPDVCDLDVWNGYKGWILAGHTHGGQVKPPFLPPSILPVKNKRYASGEISLSDGRTLYINRALGHLWQVRFNVRPEITVFELNKI